MTDAPKRIWAFLAGPMVGYFVGKTPGEWPNVGEYILAAEHERLMAEARNDALEEAARLVETHAYVTIGGVGSMEPNPLVTDDMHHATIAAAIRAMKGGGGGE